MYYYNYPSYTQKESLGTPRCHKEHKSILVLQKIAHRARNLKLNTEFFKRDSTVSHNPDMETTLVVTSLRTLGVSTSAHTNSIGDHCKKENQVKKHTPRKRVSLEQKYFNHIMHKQSSRQPNHIKANNFNSISGSYS